jgi:hypothetical protein
MKKRERHICWDHWGFLISAIAYSVGGSCHWVEVRNNETGALVAKKRFQGKHARDRAILYATYIRKGDEGERVEATTCFHCGDPAVTSIGFDPRCERHRDV